MQKISIFNRPTEQLRMKGPRFLLTGIVLLSMAVFFVVTVRFEPGWDFRNNLWAPAHLLTNHLSPYRIEALFENSGAIWLPMMIGIGFPLGYLPLQQASNVWLLINIVALTLMVYLSAGEYKFSLPAFATWTLLIVIFPSTVHLLILGQISLFIVLILLSLMKFEHKISPVMVGLFFAIALTKPQISFLFILSYLVWSWKNNQKKKAGIVLLSTCGWMLITCLPLFFFYPAWIPDLIHNLVNNANWIQPTIYSLVLGQANRINNILSVLYFLAGVALTLYIAIRFPKKTALLWSLALTSIISPYIWSWDFVILYPLLIYSYFSTETRFERWIIMGGFALCLIGFTLLRLHRVEADDQSWWIPWLLLTVAWVANISKKSARNWLYNPN